MYQCSSKDYEIIEKTKQGGFHYGPIPSAGGGDGMMTPTLPNANTSGVLTAGGGLPERVLRRAIWIQLFALAMNAKLIDRASKEAYQSFTARFDGHSLTLYAASFSKIFLDTPAAMVPLDSTLRLYQSQTVDLRSQDGRREAARILLGLVRYLNSTKSGKN
jgi:hypothetical protein